MHRFASREADTMRCPRCQVDNPRAAKVCIGCGVRLVATCYACHAELPAGARFCPECGHPAFAGALAGSRFRSPEAYTPPRLAEMILASREAMEGERKQVTVLLADLKGSLELLADRDPEDARRLLDPVLERMMEAVHHYEGTVNQVMGDGIMALFGAPVAHEDHTVRGCFAALRMRESIRRYAEEIQRREGVPIHVRIGLNSGEVVVRSIRSDLRMDYSAVGQTTHLAARMEQLAMPGSILIPERAFRLAEGYVEARRLGALPVRGLEAPVDVCEIVGAVAVRSRLQVASARGLTRFVGRETERAQLRRALQRAHGGQGQVVALVGEPGVGKSRLLHELLHSDDVRGWRRLESGAAAHTRAVAFGPVVELLRACLGLDGRDDVETVRERVAGRIRPLGLTADEPALLALLEALPAENAFEQLDPPERRRRLLEAAGQLLLRESQREPLLLLIEDLHWVDAETEAFLEALVERVPATPVLVLVSYRPEYRHAWGGKTYYAQIRVDPLEPEDAGQMASVLVGDDRGLVDLRRVLVDRTDGNPFFLEECVRTLVETGVLVGERGAYRPAALVEAIRVPPTVQAVLASRIDRLAPDDKRLLQSAAVVGKDVPLALLLAIADTHEADARAALGRLQAAEFLYERRAFPSREFTFRHALTHEVAYGSLLHDRRRALHARLVTAIESCDPDRVTEHAESLARHALEGEVWDKAVDYLRVAGAKAHARGALPESVRWYEQALDTLSRLDERHENTQRAIDVRLDLHQPAFMLGQVPRLEQLHREAESLARQIDDQRRLGRAALRLGLYAWIGARYDAGIGHAEQARAIARATRDPDLDILAIYVLGMQQLGRGAYRAAIRLFQDIVDGPDAERARRPLGFTAPPYVLGCGFLAWCLANVGEFGRARAYADRGVEWAEALAHPQAQATAYVMQLLPATGKGEFVASLPACEAAVRHCETQRALLWFGLAGCLYGRALANAGRVMEGLAWLERGRALHEGVGVHAEAALLTVWLAEALLLAGRIADARSSAERALEQARALGERGSEAEALHVLGSARAAERPPEVAAARDLQARAMALARELEMAPLVARCQLALGLLAALGGRTPEAAAGLGAARELFARLEMTTWLERTEAASAELGAGEPEGPPTSTWGTPAPPG